MPKFLSHEVLSLEDLWDELVFTEARLRHNEDAKDLAEPLTLLCDRVLEVRLGQLNAWRSEHQAQASIFGVNNALDNFTTLFERIVRRALEDAGVREPTQDPRYKVYFPESLSRITGRALRSQLEVTRPMIAQLRIEKLATVSAQLTGMEALYNQGVAALDEQQRVEALRRNHRNEEIAAIFEEANKARKSVFGALTLREVERSQPKGWAESFFRKSSRSEVDFAEVKQDAISLMCKARGISVSKENQKRLYAQTDLSILDRWLSQVSTITSEADLFS